MPYAFMFTLQFYCNVDLQALVVSYNITGKLILQFFSHLSLTCYLLCKPV